MLISSWIQRYRANKTVEHVEPFVIGLLAGGAVWALGWHMPHDTGTQNSALSASMTVGSIIFGFLTSGLIMLLSFNGSRIEQLRDSGYIQDVVLYFKEAIALVLLFVLLSLLGFFLETERPEFMGVWTGAGVASLIGFSRIFSILSWLLNDRA